MYIYVSELCIGYSNRNFLVYPVPGFDKASGKGKCWGDQGEGGEPAGCQRKMLETDLAEDSFCHRWPFSLSSDFQKQGNPRLHCLPIKTLMFKKNKQIFRLIIEILRNLDLAMCRSFCNGCLCCPRNCLLQQRWLIQLCPYQVNGLNRRWCYINVEWCLLASSNIFL